MNHILKNLCKMLCRLALTAAVVSINVTCYRSFYQDTLSESLESLRKYKDE